ncbi:MAG: hypothetical protein FVQ79_12200 [Planctomycetes bacterium]|nr:hypothetical protein [Planctomycetota bacterium]
MNKYMVKLVFAVFCTSVVFIVGCIPERSLEWSADGSVGLLQYDNDFYLVDGESGALTEVAKGNVMPWPDISDDGKLIAYCERLECENLNEGLKLLPENHARKIKSHAEWLKKEIIANGLHKGELPRLKKTRLSGSFGPGAEQEDTTSEYTKEYCAWVMRCLCETADDELTGKLTSEIVSDGKNLKLAYYRLIVAKREELSDKKVAATSVLAIFKAMFSPDSSHIAYLMINPEGSDAGDLSDNMSYQLYIASPKQNIAAMRVSHDVAFGYDWRQDGRAIAYIRGDMTNDADMIFGELTEANVVDANGILLAEKLDNPQGALATHICHGKRPSPVGVLFYPWSKLEYGPGGRIFFVNLALTLPATTYEDPPMSLFCYDTVTKTVNNVLPLNLSGYIGGAMEAFQFSLSQDGKSVLLPLENNRFMIYELGSREPGLPIEEGEGFGDGDDMLSPAWKGKDEISCLVSEKSHFLVKEGQDKHHRKEFVILGADGKFQRVLSEKWAEW